MKDWPILLILALLILFIAYMIFIFAIMLTGHGGPAPAP
jgi:hypothetical protein